MEYRSEKGKYSDILLQRVRFWPRMRSSNKQYETKFQCGIIIVTIVNSWSLRENSWISCRVAAPLRQPEVSEMLQKAGRAGISHAGISHD